MQVDNVEILTVEEFLDFILLILKIPFLLFLFCKCKVKVHRTTDNDVSAWQ
jgi:hypothetical protein